MPKIIKFKNCTAFGRLLIICLVITVQSKSISAQELQFYGIPEYGSRSIGMGLTGIIDAYGPLSVLRNPALNRTGKRVTIKPFFQWIGNGEWEDVTLIPRQLNDMISPDNVSSATGLTSRYLGGVIQGRGFTLGYIHSNRKEFLFRDLRLYGESSKYFGRRVKSDLLFAGYNLKFSSKGRIGFMLKNFQFRDTGNISTPSSSIVNRDGVDIFLDEKESTKETTVAVDIGGLLGLSLLNKPVTIGFSLINVVSSDSANEEPMPFYLNAGIAVVPLRNLLLEFNVIDISDEDGMFSKIGKRIGIEYTMRGLRIRSGFYGDNLSFGLGVGGEGLSIDYGVIEIDHTPVIGRDNKEKFQSIQVSISGNFY
ncbi:hypothetical protein E3V55_07210 [Candidatus Marinimicrobia bacterium MT.SAG.3]|nr:hypothetical protein E3V55_07210 [Candidatus Marinimicrobia bacterium MT.SAG.3]